MREIKILGTGCPKCRELFENAQEAVNELNGEYSLEKVTELSEIMSYGVMLTPAIVVDGEVKAAGKVPSVEAIKEMIV